MMQTGSLPPYSQVMQTGSLPPNCQVMQTGSLPPNTRVMQTGSVSHIMPFSSLLVNQMMQTARSDNQLTTVVSVSGIPIMSTGSLLGNHSIQTGSLSLDDHSKPDSINNSILCTHVARIGVLSGNGRAQSNSSAGSFNTQPVLQPTHKVMQASSQPGGQMLQACIPSSSRFVAQTNNLPATSNSVKSSDHPAAGKQKCSSSEHLSRSRSVGRVFRF